MPADQTTLPLPEPEAWTRPKGKHACTRRPEAGPGTCWWWWEDCLRAEKRGCYQLWRERRDRQREERV